MSRSVFKTQANIDFKTGYLTNSPKSGPQIGVTGTCLGFLSFLQKGPENVDRGLNFGLDSDFSMDRPSAVVENSRACRNSDVQACIRFFRGNKF